MKTIFIDCNPQMEPVFRRVHRADDPAITVNLAQAPGAIPPLVAGYQVVIDDHSHLPTDVVKQCPDLRHVVFLGVGAASYMNVAELKELGVTVHTIKGYGDRAVAEHTVALLFASARSVAGMDRELRAGTWRPQGGMQLDGKVLGLIGLGGIGLEVARIAKGIGMEVIAWNRSPVPDAPVPLVSRDEVLARADILSLHIALNDETRGMLGATELAKLKPGAILINTARGALVDEAALIQALESGHLRHAGLDVFANEPLAADHPLTRLPNVTLTSHAAFRTPEASETLIRRAIDIVKRVTAAG
ncbi:glycerate dehydrogenase [Aliidongia dinghuensis]|uniref:Glycerate dehydrogenase n=1 Tax=Aliidongia dinghuensis TaxID=1867774 RepID=A0A8J2YTI8_9PROT|nr:NAD(P)-dependent oxidoreductase [Aliidongia dinghuensis]GGF19311.1 glycerate dehydrogenase [Aliidongia dinghuensis]